VEVGIYVMMSRINVGIVFFKELHLTGGRSVTGIRMKAVTGSFGSNESVSSLREICRESLPRNHAYQYVLGYYC
jgi:hypothetical protein